MDKAAVGALRAEAKRVINALLILGPVPVIARLPAELAEASLVIRTLLLLLGCARVIRFVRMTVNTCLLLIAVAALLEEPADGDLVFDIAVQILALIALPTDILEPVHADFLLELLHIGSRFKRNDHLLELVEPAWIQTLSGAIMHGSAAHAAPSIISTHVHWRTTALSVVAAVYVARCPIATSRCLALPRNIALAVHL